MTTYSLRGLYRLQWDTDGNGTYDRSKHSPVTLNLVGRDDLSTMSYTYDGGHPASVTITAETYCYTFPGIVTSRELSADVVRVKWGAGKVTDVLVEYEGRTDEAMAFRLAGDRLPSSDNTSAVKAFWASLENGVRIKSGPVSPDTTISLADLPGVAISQDDRITSFGKTDMVFGGRGNDFIIGGFFIHDRLFGGLGHDHLVGLAGDDQLVGGYGNDRLFGGFDDDVLSGGLGNDQLFGGKGQDLLNGGTGRDISKGGSGGDVLIGGAGGDVLQGQAGRDILRGQAGADKLNGGKGQDILYAGRDSASDSFVFLGTGDSRPGAGKRDSLLQFDTGVDKIDLARIDANTTQAGNQVFTFSDGAAKAHSVWTVLQGQNLLLQADVNGDATADFELLIVDVVSVAIGDLLL